MRARRFCLVLALALAGCRFLPDNGYAVDVRVVPAAALPATTVRAIATLDEQVGGVENYHQRYAITTQLGGGEVRFIYRPLAGAGTLTFTIDARDAADRLLASGQGRVALKPGHTVALTIVLGAASPPVADLAQATCVPDLLAPADDLASVDLAPVPVDQQLCIDACQALIDCGVAYEPATCTRNCLNAPIFRACAKTVGSDCNQLALCSFKQYQAVVCPAGTGYPMGTATCKLTAMCEGACNVFNPTALCGCTCISRLDPQKAIYSMINVACAQYNCTNVCAPPNFNGQMCDACAQMKCGSNPCFSN
jgi:hypothetical protein